ncbi:type II secretion system minor pseudopilin GspI [Parendozoicomonas sp. Alg238-R29]|uniref:type II secretion system minor pseudopilin GspI n=1 Tax=Parendozoicomonas sp. Alg238-R29 TaxID=2993446 RepID=UPI00248E73B9|nr:type II secretion system minor pseudopilin GspI [Parendozoicomonas sp. Alg238-R29]
MVRLQPLEHKNKTSLAGFTLLEILVALAIFALAASILLVADGRAIRQTARIQEKVQASWLADNQLNQYYIEASFPEPGQRSNTTEIGGKQWYIRDTISETSQRNLRKVDVEVFPGKARPTDKAKPAFRLTGYIRRGKE